MQVFCKNASGGGAIWEAPNTTNLKAFDDSYLLLHYKNAKNKSRILLLYNDGKVAESSNSRRSLGLYYLAESVLDSAHKSQKDAKFVFLQNIDMVDEAYPNEVSYPSAVIDENTLFVGYTYNRKGIKLQKIKLAEIEKKIAESTLFGGLESSELKGDSSFCFHKKKQKLLRELCEADEIKGVSYKSFLDSAIPQNLGENISSLRDSAEQNRGKPPCAKNIKSQCGLPHSPTLARNDDSLDSSVAMLPQNDKNSVRVAESALDSATFSQGGLPHSPTLARNDDSLDSSVAMLPQNDNITNLAESSAESTTNYDIVGIYLLFLSTFLFLTKSLSKRIKYLALPCFVTLISIPFIFVLWDYYSIIMLLYSLFGGASVFCALLCARYILVEILPRRFCEAQNLVVFFEILRFAQNDKCKGDSANSRNLALTISIFSIPLFLGHLGLVNFDILRNEIASAIFVSAFIVALFWVDKWAFIFALIALILTKSLFGLFDGYLLIFSVVYCAIWAAIKIYSKIIAQA